MGYEYQESSGFEIRVREQGVGILGEIDDDDIVIMTNGNPCGIDDGDFHMEVDAETFLNSDRFPGFGPSCERLADLQMTICLLTTLHIYVQCTYI